MISQTQLLDEKEKIFPRYKRHLIQICTRSRTNSQHRLETKEEITEHEAGRHRSYYLVSTLLCRLGILVIKYAKDGRDVLDLWKISWLKHPPQKSGDSRAPLGLRRPRGATTSHPHSSTTTCRRKNGRRCPTSAKGERGNRPPGDDSLAPPRFFFVAACFFFFFELQLY